MLDQSKVAKKNMSVLVFVLSNSSRLYLQGGPQKCPHFSLAITYKNKETFKIFSPQILEVCRILLVQTTLESPMFYYAFLVINNRFDPGTMLLYDSSNSNIKIAHNCIEYSCGICVISLLMLSLRPSVVSGVFS